ncbi:hypothetical protein AVEN_10039-1 [Araneus ventricosus]|uniref:Uncharacterized protein n=1 Tax=Araneus ventricosus TaxID=182803 RepID=A0A4Y2N9Q1_ARAVE|nr:hypothetical protein AVEN_264325-1 [Araneus ventricosus]GBN35935.1 hypothetical protein AVEN_178625-1 [Araneus ventricosus]GBN36112.1 hypothetical protein AVEN_239396-1 [Araneus ventricosus]GBN36115.1 hypothetical protein AVEN_10039-1 [Araneus ventricosus]
MRFNFWNSNRLTKLTKLPINVSVALNSRSFSGNKVFGSTTGVKENSLNGRVYECQNVTQLPIVHVACNPLHNLRYIPIVYEKRKWHKVDCLFPPFRRPLSQGMFARDEERKFP